MKNAQGKSQETLTSPQSVTDGFKRILVAVDNQSETEQVFETAMELARVNGGCLMIFHSLLEEIPGVPEISTFASMGGYSWAYTQEMMEMKEQLLEEEIEKLEAWLQSLCARARELGISTECIYCIGAPGSQICAQAKKWEADLIVLGRRGLTGISEILLGSVSNYVTHHAHCSVLVVQQKTA